MDSEQFGKGAVKSAYDERDYQMEEVARGVAPFNWTDGFDIETQLGMVLAAKDQGQSGSCGGQASSMLAAVQEFLASKSFEERSAKYPYSQVCVPGGGSNARALLGIYTTQGISIEALCSSYQNGNTPTEAFMARAIDITPAARANAKTDLAKNYVSVSPDIDSIALAVQQYGGVMIGIDGADNGTWLSEFPKKPVDGQALWRHFLYVGKAKMINGVKHIGVLNSWGSSVGDKGWQWLSEDYVKASVYDKVFGIEQACVWEAWTAVFNLNPIVSFTHNFTKDIAYGQTSEEVRALQMALQHDGSFPAGFDLSVAAYPKAYYGDMTATAILKFRIKYGIDTSTDPKGKSAGPRTRAKLNELYNK